MGNLEVFMFGMGVGMILAVILFFLVTPSIQLSQETADDICQQLTGNKTATASKESYKQLICELPSFDETQNIIIKPNSERD